MPASIRLYGLPVGVLDVAKDGDLSFRYEQGWLERKQLPHHPLSLALPLSPDPYDHDRAGPFFDGLLPDSQQTREALARYLQVDATDDYALLYQLGRDCPGAVTVMPLNDEVIADENVETKWDVPCIFSYDHEGTKVPRHRCHKCRAPAPRSRRRLRRAQSFRGNRGEPRTSQAE